MLFKFLMGVLFCLRYFLIDFEGNGFFGEGWGILVLFFILYGNVFFGDFLCRINLVYYYDCKLNV